MLFQRSDIDALKNIHSPLIVPGTNIPIKNNINESYYQENSPNGILSSDIIKSIINNLRHKFNTEIIFVKSGFVAPNTAPAYVTRMKRSDIDRLKKMRNINSDFLYHIIEDNSMWKDYDAVIIVNIDITSSDYHGRTTSLEKYLEELISHEYGHTITIDQISNNDMSEYTIKKEILKLIYRINKSVFKIDDMTLSAEYLYLYHTCLKPEVLADNAGHVNISELIDQRERFQLERLMAMILDHHYHQSISIL